MSHRVGGLPLALRLAGLYLQQTAATPGEFADQGTVADFTAYRTALDAGRLDLLTEHDNGLSDNQVRARNDIRRTWELSLDLLASRQLPFARPLLRLLAFFGNAPTPYRLLLHPPTISRSPLFADLDGPTLWRTLQALNGLGLIDMNAHAPDTDAVGPQMLSLHPLVRDASRHHGTPQVDEYLSLAVALLNRATGEDLAGQPRDTTRWHTWQALEPHVFDVQASAGLAHQELRPMLLRRVGFAVLKVSQSMRARAAARGLAGDAALHTAIHHLSLLLGDEHPDILTIREARAIVMRTRGDFDAARAELRAVLDIRRRTLGDEHPATRSTRREVERLVQ